MRTIGKILIIELAAALIGWAMIAAVNANGSSAPVGFDGQRGAESRLAGAIPGDLPEGMQPGRATGSPPEGAPFGDFPEGLRREGERTAGGLWMADTIKNLGIIAVLVAVVVLARGLFRKSAAPVAVKVGQ